MGLVFEEDIRVSTVHHTAEKMLAAARTAPKGRGTDNLVMAIADEKGIKEISDKLKEMSSRENLPAFFMRDAQNILSAQRMILIGTRIGSLGLEPCGMCGFANCEEKNGHPDHPCAFNTGDLGIAIGSAVSVAMDARVDNRIMYTVGQAALRMGLLGKDVKIAYGIPLSIGSKNPFFDRK